jgi:zinc protease
MVEIAWQTPAMFDTDDAALDVAAVAIRDRLDDRLVDSLHVAKSVGAAQSSHADASIFFVRAEAAGGNTAAGLRRAIDEEMARVVKDGLSADEVAAARRKMLTTASSADDPAHLARRIAAASALPDGVAKLARDPERYSGVDVAAVMTAIRRHLVADRRVTALVERKAGSPIEGRLVGGNR